MSGSLVASCEWKKMSEHVFPWPHEFVLLAVFDKDDPEVLAVRRVHVAEHGAFFTRDGSWLTILEQGWVPYAWKVDDTPGRDDSEWPPLRRDYIVNLDEA